MHEFLLLLGRRYMDIQRDDYRIGTVSALLANIHRDRKRRRKPYTPEDFMPKPQGTKGRQKVQEMVDTVKGLHLLYTSKKRSQGG